MSISKTIFTVTGITLLSRLLSLVSLQVYMAFFGPQGTLINIYAYALSMPNIIFNVVGTIITAVVVPIYSGLLSTNKDEASAFINNIMTLVAIGVALLVAIGMVGAPFLASITDFPDHSTQFLIYSLRVMMFAMFFYGMHYIFQGILHSHSKFMLVAFVTVPTSTIVISYVLLFGNTFGVPGLLYATVFGLSLQAALLWPAVRKVGVRYKPTLNLRNPNIRNAMALSVPILLSVASFQVNTIFNNTLATRFNLVAIMGYVQNLMLVLILSIIYSITGVYLPRLTKIWENEQQNFKTELENVLITVLLIIVPAAFGFYRMRFEIINLLAGWGNFDHQSVLIASQMLGLYGFGIVGIGLKEVLDRAFFAQKNTKISGLVGLLITVINITFSLTFINHLGFATMPISFAISTSLGSLILIITMHKKVAIVTPRLTLNIVKIFVASYTMFICTTAFKALATTLWTDTPLLDRTLALALPALGGILTYTAAIIILRVDGVAPMLKKLTKR